MVEYILVPIGGGGLATGVSTLAKLLNPKIKVIGVEPAGASLYAGILKSRKSNYTSECEYHCGWYSRKDTGRKDFPIYPEKFR